MTALTPPSPTEITATVCFALAILHTFLVKRFQHLAHSYPSGSVGENLFHLLGEIEVVFGFWAGLYLLAVMLTAGASEAIQYLEGQNFTEPAFVFVIMTVCSTRPILAMAEWLIGFLARWIPLQQPIAFYFTTLTVGPWLGSLITEPAAMTVTALILLERYYRQGISKKLMYATIGLLFVNVSIGGTLTPFAAPPVLMVASKWDWGLYFMLTHFGWKGIVASAISTGLVAYRFRKELANLNWADLRKNSNTDLPFWVTAIHLVMLFFIVATAHHMTVFIGLFLFFLGIVSVTKEYQRGLKLREGLLVAFFLGGLVVLGTPQRWWLEPILTQLSTLPLYLGAMGLTAITDNAALTYLGSQVPTLSESSRYALVAGSLVGGGLTVIANAPNPAGYGILNASFGEDKISPLGLFASALIPTLIAGLVFWFL